LTIVQDRVTLAADYYVHRGHTGRCDPVDGFVSRQDAAIAADVTLDVVKSWQFRGWLAGDGERRKLRVDGVLVHIDDVLDAERDTRQKRGRSHRRLRAPELAA
jgi:hypothetical protein